MTPQNHSPLRGFLSLTLGILLAFTVLQSARAQVADTESSAITIANYIAADLGGDPSKYLAYARELVKIIAKLEPQQQENVFGEEVFNEIVEESAPGGGQGKGKGKGKAKGMGKGKGNS